MKLGPRIDLPPLDLHGPWPTEAPPRTRSAVVRDMQAARRRPKWPEGTRLVPEDVRQASAERWRQEHEALLAGEIEQGERLEAEGLAWARWCTRPWWSRLIDCAFRERPPVKPRGPGHVPFADITIFRHVPKRPDVADALGFDSPLYSSFDIPMPRHDEAP